MMERRLDRITLYYIEGEKGQKKEGKRLSLKMGQLRLGAKQHLENFFKFQMDAVKPKITLQPNYPLLRKAKNIEEEFEILTGKKFVPEYSVEIKPYRAEPLEEQDSFDVICPMYFFDPAKVESNILNWFREIPIRKLYIGISNPEKPFFISHPKIEIIDQMHIKTLGGCLCDLMKRVETNWFVYLHSDASIVEYGFDMMRFFMKDKVGIIESERIEQNGEINKEPVDLTPKSEYLRYHFRKRSYSGFQLFQKKAIESFLSKLEDDYGYRNEDLIFQSQIEHLGYEYKKTFAMHIHQVKNHVWSTSEKQTNEMQWKGLVKYAYPSNPNIRFACLSMIKFCRGERHVYDLRLHHVLQFCAKWNPDWGYYVREEWEKWEEEDKQNAIK